MKSIGRQALCPPQLYRVHWRIFGYNYLLQTNFLFITKLRIASSSRQVSPDCVSLDCVYLVCIDVLKVSIYNRVQNNDNFGVRYVPRSISGYNSAAKMGKAAAVKYCQEWQAEVVKASTVLATEYTGKKIDKSTYNYRRENLNKQTQELNECVQSINRQFGAG